MKKIILILSVLFLFGCSFTNSPSSVVENYLNKYINLDEDVITDLDTTIINENLSDNNKDIYKKVLERQYSNIKYNIIDESISDDKSTVKVEITVYDLYKSSNNSDNYMNEHIEEFTDINNIYDNESYTTFKLNQMLETTDTVTYDITFELNKKDNMWYLVSPSRTILEKIHGLYNYNN